MRRKVGSGTAPFNYQLFRSEVRPFGSNADTIGKSTFQQGYDFFGNSTVAGKDLYNKPSDVVYTSNTDVGDAGCIRRPRAEFVIGNGVIDFGVRVFTKNTVGVLEEAFPMDRRAASASPVPKRVFAATTDTTKLHPAIALQSGNFDAAATSYGYPSAVEVMVRILSPEGVQIIQAYETDPNRYGGASASKWWELAEANSKVYVRRVEIRSSAL
jgi:hypothetical protein